jgi:ABC-2 type transport system permease protein
LSRRDPLLPNAAIVARREYRERVRSRLFLVSTLVLAGIAAVVSLGPLALRVLDRGSVTEIVVVAPDRELLARTMASLEGVLNMPREGVEASAAEPSYSIAPAGDAAGRRMSAGRVDGALVVERTPALAAFSSIPAGRQAPPRRSWWASAPGAAIDRRRTADDATNVFHPPSFQVLPTNVPTDEGRPIDPQAVASRSFLGIAFVVLIFITLVIYGMWVATGVAAEKSSRVMELMISAASPVQLLVAVPFVPFASS